MLPTPLIVLLCLATPGAALLTPQQRALHLLNRIAFGPTQASLEGLMHQGLDAYVQAQLHPESLADPNMPSLASFTSLTLDGQALWETYEKKMPVADPNEPPATAARRRDAIEELAAARLLRARYSAAQLNEVMVDFWMNHFNVSFKAVHTAVIPLERDVIRPLMWGKFAVLLLATARAPAMLRYLNNAQSVAPPAQRQRPPQGPQGGKTDLRGLNENYAREVMELHTLGVNGGYTQHDVTDLARALTGWSLEKDGGGFVFKAKLHDVGAKTILGIPLPANGDEQEGVAMLHVLAHHPSTAHHLAGKLCERLVSDTCSEAWVGRIATQFLASDGDLRDTVGFILTQPEFFAPQNFQSKVKTPFEFVVSALRAVDASTDGGAPLQHRLHEMDEPLYQCQPPTGYADRADAWVSAGGVLARLNFALALTANKVHGTEVDVNRMVVQHHLQSGAMALQTLQTLLLGGQLLSPATSLTIERATGDPQNTHSDPTANTEVPRLMALILGSPEFQRQ